jgi:hypothetical protein
MSDVFVGLLLVIGWVCMRPGHRLLYCFGTKDAVKVVGLFENVGRSCWIIRRNSPGISNGTDTLGSFRQLDVREVCEISQREKQCESAPMNSRGEQSLSLTKNCDKLAWCLWNSYSVLNRREVLVRSRFTGAISWKCYTELDEGFKGVKLSSQLCLAPSLTTSFSVSLLLCHVFMTWYLVKHTKYFAFLECGLQLDVKPEELKQTN